MKTSNDLIVNGAQTVTKQLTSLQATGTAPLVVASTSQVLNLYVARAVLADSGGAGIVRNINNVAVNTTMAATALTDYVYFVTALAIMSLPAAVGNTNRYTVKNRHTANITVDTAGAELVEGAASISVSPEASVDLLSNGTNWYVV